MTKPGAANPMELGNGQHPNQNWIRRRRRRRTEHIAIHKYKVTAVGPDCTKVDYDLNTTDRETFYRIFDKRMPKYVHHNKK